MNKKEVRKNNVKNRYQRIKSLRSMKAPAWIIKSEQIALVLNKIGRKHYGIGSTPSQLQGELYQKYVIPLMNDEE